MTTPPYDSDDERDDLAALDFSVAAAGSGTGEAGNIPAPLFSVTNPPGTVTVTTFMDGRVNHIELSPKVTDMTETDLATEIVLIAGLATQDAKSAQYAFMLEGMREQGHDDAATRDFLTRDLDLPTPEQAQAARAELFATRYVGDHD
jgi:hypothetical protein